MDFDLNLLKVFLEVYQYHSYTKASETIGITQPAVSASIKRLEQEIGETLFFREGRKMKPTAMAIRLAGRFRLGFDEIQNALNERFTYSVYVNEALALNLPELPSMMIEHTPLDQEMLLAQLKSLSVDLAVGIMMVKDHSIITEPLFKESTVIVCRHDHPRVCDQISTDQFYEESHVALATQWKGMDGFEHIRLDRPKGRNIQCKTHSISAMLLDVATSDRVAVVPQHLAMSWKERLNLQVLENPIEHKPLEYSLAYHRRYQKTENHMKVRENIRLHLSNVHIL
ncbi:LysR family transcriptional regulator [Photobacterium sp. DNB22_13_2]